MPWTEEDTKDVLKKVLGGVIAAAILAMAYAIYERMEWYVSAALGIVLVLLIIAGVSLLGGRGRTRPEVTLPGPGGVQRDSASAPVPGTPSPDHAVSRSDGQPPSVVTEVDEKVAKKAAKSDYKRKKKEAKAREKSSGP